MTLCQQNMISSVCPSCLPVCLFLCGYLCLSVCVLYWCLYSYLSVCMSLDLVSIDVSAAFMLLKCVLYSFMLSLSSTFDSYLLFWILVKFLLKCWFLVTPIALEQMKLSAPLIFTGDFNVTVYLVFCLICLSLSICICVGAMQYIFFLSYDSCLSFSLW